MRSWRIVAPVLALLVATATTAHAQSGSVARAALAPASAPSEVVERFMRLASSGDYVQMGNFFGTREGPIGRHDSERAIG